MELIMCKAEFEIPSHLKEVCERHVTKFTQLEFNQHSKINHFPPPYYYLPSPLDTYGEHDDGCNSRYKKEGKEGVPGAAKYSPANANY
jgi:hypothetical protein